MSHRHACASYLPNLGSEPDIDEIVSGLTQNEIETASMYESNHGTGMYDFMELKQAFHNYAKSGETESALISPEDLKVAVLRAGMEDKGDLDRFLYTPVEDHGEFRFHAEGQHKRVHRDRNGETALIEGREQMYDCEDQRRLLETIVDNHYLLEESEHVEPPSSRDPELIEYEDRPILKYGFNQDMTPIRELPQKEYSKVEKLVEKAEAEMQELISSDEFITTEPQDFKFISGGERAETHVLVPTSEREDLEELEELMVGDMGEIARTYGDNSSTDFAIN